MVCGGFRMKGLGLLEFIGVEFRVSGLGALSPSKTQMVCMAKV